MAVGCCLLNRADFGSGVANLLPNPPTGLPKTGAILAMAML